MKKRFKLILLGLLFLNKGIGAQSIETKLQAVMDSIYAANPTSVGILAHVESKDRKLSWSGASGYSDKANNNVLEADQTALIASNTKTYVSATILRLVELGKLNIDQPIAKLLNDKTRMLFEQGGYALESILIKHLLSHTSGVNDFANQEYLDFISNDKSHRWTRDEQLELTIKSGAPLGKPGTGYSYSDANYLLLAEIIENTVNKPFYSAIRELLGYKSLGLKNTWFPTLEKKPKRAKPLAHQYWGKYGWDSKEIDVSVDLYGGGGIACTTKDLSRFAYQLFNAEIIKDPSIFNLIFTEIQTQDEVPSDYYFGLSLYESNGFKAYGHGGFWGTIVLYFPELKTSIAVFVLEKDQRKIRKDIVDLFINLIKS